MSSSMEVAKKPSGSLKRPAAASWMAWAQDKTKIIKNQKKTGGCWQPTNHRHQRIPEACTEQVGWPAPPGDAVCP